MKKCIFCKIINGEESSVKIWEDENFIAILDINPNTKGMTVLITKDHFTSYFNELPEDLYSKFFGTVKKVSKKLERGLGVKRVAVVVEGLGINHAHIKLYPIFGLKSRFEEIWAKDKIYFDSYEGYISTKTGPAKSIEELKEIAKEINSKS
jgi:histidine triad (HIT) family protein